MTTRTRTRPTVEERLRTLSARYQDDVAEAEFYAAYRQACGIAADDDSPPPTPVTHEELDRIEEGLRKADYVEAYYVQRAAAEERARREREAHEERAAAEMWEQYRELCRL